MKIKVLLLTILVSINVNAQRFSVGIRPGLDIVNFKLICSDSIYPGTFKPRLSFDIALTFEYRIANRFKIQLEPGFVEKGTRLFYWGSEKPVIIMNGYIQTALVFKIQPINKLFIEIGPEYGYIIDMRRREEDGSINKPLDNSIAKEEFSSIFGLNYTITPNISFGMRYIHSFTPIYDDIASADPFGSNIPYKIFNKQFSFGLCYLFKSH